MSCAILRAAKRSGGSPSAPEPVRFRTSDLFPPFVHILIGPCPRACLTAAGEKPLRADSVLHNLPRTGAGNRI